jgi:hypothetical protein
VDVVTLMVAALEPLSVGGAQSAQMIDEKDKVGRVQCSQNCGWFLCCWGRSKRSWDIMVGFDFWSCERDERREEKSYDLHG